MKEGSMSHGVKPSSDVKPIGKPPVPNTKVEQYYGDIHSNNKSRLFRSHQIKSMLKVPVAYMHECIEMGLVLPKSYVISGWVFCLLAVYILVLYKRLVDFGVTTALARDILLECHKEDIFIIGDNTLYSSKGIEISLPVADIINIVNKELIE